MRERATGTISNLSEFCGVYSSWRITHKKCIMNLNKRHKWTMNYSLSLLALCLNERSDYRAAALADPTQNRSILSIQIHSHAHLSFISIHLSHRAATDYYLYLRLSKSLITIPPELKVMSLHGLLYPTRCLKTKMNSIYSDIKQRKAEGPSHLRSWKGRLFGISAWLMTNNYQNCC